MGITRGLSMATRSSDPAAAASIPRNTATTKTYGEHAMTRAFKTMAIVLMMAALVAGCQTMTGKSAGENIDDGTITASVKSKLVADKAVGHIIPIRLLLFLIVGGLGVAVVGMRLPCCSHRFWCWVVAGKAKSTRKDARAQARQPEPLPARRLSDPPLHPFLQAAPATRARLARRAPSAGR